MINKIFTRPFFLVNTFLTTNIYNISLLHTIILYISFNKKKNFFFFKSVLYMTIRMNFCNFVLYSYTVDDS